MKTVKLTLLLLVVLVGSLKAQSGCLVPGGEVYTQPETDLVNVIIVLLFGPAYRGTPTNQYGPCINKVQNAYLPDNSRNCRVCRGGGFTVVIPGVLATCGTPTIDGKIATLQVIQCDLDDYSWAFGASAAALGLILIRKRKLF